ncbi:MAG: AMP-binding protein [Acidimicrobiales bacterium]
MEVDAGPGISRIEGPAPGHWWSAGAFEEATRRAANRLLGAGLVAGDRVIWSVSSSVAALVSNVASLRAGLVVVPVNTSSTERERAHVVREVLPAAAIVDRKHRAGWIAGAIGAPDLVLGPELDLPDADGLPIDTVDPDDPALICFTSGTTGLPKGAVLRHRHLLAGMESLRLAWRWTEGDRLVHALPVFHVHGLCVGIYGTLTAGASALLLPGFDEHAVADATSDCGATLFFGVPTMYHRLVASGLAGALGRLRLCVSGSSPLPAALFDACHTSFGGSVLERYGMTETLINTSNPYDGERRAGSVGFPLPEVELRFSSDGEILVRGPNVFDGYWHRPHANEEAFEPAADGGDPWFHTGDLGVDDDGMLVIRGRSKELILSGGLNVYPAEVEDVIGRHPGVAEVAVTGTPSDEWGEVVTAWIVPDGKAPTAEDLAEFCRPLLARYKHPRRVRTVEALPRNALGKVLRSRLGR